MRLRNFFMIAMSAPLVGLVGCATSPKSSQGETPVAATSSAPTSANATSETAATAAGKTAPAAKKPTKKPAKKIGAKMEKQGITIEELVVGTGTTATTGKTVKVHYTGTLTSGKKFDSSVDRGEPFSFGLGSGQVIKGWDIGVEGMKVGGKRKLTIPADKAYGNRDVGNGLIPANSTLVFEVELLGVGA